MTERQEVSNQLLDGATSTVSQHRKWTRWVLVIINTVVFAHGSVVLNSYGRLMPDLLTEYPKGILTISSAGALGTGLSYMLGYPTVLLQNKIGFLATSSLGTILISLGCMCIAFFTGAYVVMLGYGLLVGLGVSFQYFSLAYLATELFPFDDPQHVRMVGLIFIAMHIAMTITGPYTDMLLTKGWVFTMVLFGIVNIALGVMSLTVTFILQRYNNPQNIDPEAEISLIKTTANTADNKAATVREDEKSNLLQKMETSAYSKWRLVIIFIMYASVWLLGYAPTLLPYMTIVEHAKLLGVNTHSGSRLELIYGLTGLVGQFLLAIFGDNFIKGKSRYVYFTSLGVGILLNILAATWTEYWLLVIYSIICGIIQSSWTFLSYAVSSEVLQNDFSKELFSLANVMAGGGGIILMVFSGYIQETTGSLKDTFYVNAVLSTCALIIFVLLHFVIIRK